MYNYTYYYVIYTFMVYIHYLFCRAFALSVLMLDKIILCTVDCKSM